MQAWLVGKESVSRIDVEFTDVLQRVATVHVKDLPDEHWEYLYDCWRRTDVPAKP